MTDTRAWAWVVGVLVVVVVTGAAFPPAPMNEVGALGEGGIAPLLFPHPQYPLPRKRYLGIELPDFIAAGKGLGDLKERMMTSGK
ncbi:hypothetical protein O3P69_019764 [Scylla paramamosain]|uniref:Uncharacterized protein n=1 Tax=Scylla paramamosain TaxID=85552 RepID=A0AAW0SYF8_SCYPA